FRTSRWVFLRFLSQISSSRRSFIAIALVMCGRPCQHSYALVSRRITDENENNKPRTRGRGRCRVPGYRKASQSLR
ncbi:hypothetical protein BJV78DRAFT_1253336, partial [Lactifluus subvellereus]